MQAQRLDERIDRDYRYRTQLAALEFGESLAGDGEFRAWAERYREDRRGFLLDCVDWHALGDRPSSYQLDLATLLDHKDRLAGRGPRGLGKTFFEAMMILHHCLTREALGIDWKVVTTASVGQQLTDYLWPEIRKCAGVLLWDKIGRPRLNTSRELMLRTIRLAHGTAIAVYNPEAMKQEGAHAEEMLYVFTEAKLIPTAVWDSVEGVFSTEQRYKWLALSTPAGAEGRFYDIFARKPGLEDWATRVVTVDEAVAAGRVSSAWVERMRLLWGEDHPLYQAQVLGGFADQRSAGLIPLGWVEQAMERWYAWQAGGGEGAVVSIGVDVGGGAEGGDVSVIAAATAHYEVDTLLKIPVALDPSRSTMELAGRLRAMIAQLGSVRHVSVDVIGIGAGLVHRLREMGYRIFAFHAGMATQRTDISGEFGMANVRAASWVAMRELLDPGSGSSVALPPDDDLKGELTAPRIKRITSTARMVIEDKDELKRRLRRSTNCADAVIMALTGPLFEREQMEQGAFEVFYQEDER